MPGWSRPFDDPIPLPDGRELRTLRDAGHYIARLPKRQHDSFAWRAATEALLLIAEHGGPMMLARIAVMRALYPGETVTPPRRQRGKNIG